jgi:hypothetical protein
MTPAVVLILAHAGHWLEAALFAPPTVLVLVATARSVRDERARRRAATSLHGSSRRIPATGPDPRKETS